MSTGDTGSTTTTTTAQPWSGQKSYLTQGYKQAANLLQAPGPQYYPGTQVAPFTQAQNQALGAQVLRGQQGSPLDAAAQQQQMDTLQGKYLSAGNPYDDSVFQNIQSHVLPSVSSQFLSGDRYGSGNMQDTQTRALTEAYAPYAFSNYQNERGLQQQAAGLAPTLAGEDYKDIAAQYSAGQTAQQQQQQQIDADMQKWAYNQNLPYTKLNNYTSEIGGAVPGGGSTTQPYYQPSVFSQLVGGLLGGAGLAGSLGWQPFSDRRLKTDIKRVGKTDKGLPIYTYRYKGTLGELDPGLHLGVMAQEAAKKFPEAIGERMGYMTVDYGGLA